MPILRNANEGARERLYRGPAGEWEVLVHGARALLKDEAAAAGNGDGTWVGLAVRELLVRHSLGALHIHGGFVNDGLGSPTQGPRQGIVTGWRVVNIAQGLRAQFPLVHAVDQRARWP